MPKAKLPAKPWPRLSETLPFERHPNICQSCGRAHIDPGVKLGRWMEHDDNDQGQAIVVVLCKGCSDKLIDPHPRLYRALDPLEPMPGCMDVCLACGMRRGVRCVSHLAQVNGGPGLLYTPMPRVIGRACGRRFSRPIWDGGPVESCSGFVPGDDIVDGGEAEDDCAPH